MSFTRISFISLLFCNVSLYGQVNKSTAENYKERVASTLYEYSTNYDNGYIMLRDGTVLTGDISLAGKSYDQIAAIKIRTTGGVKYVFSPRSLSEYGLSNSLVNDTPDLFDWVQPNKKSAFTGFNEVRIGSNDFGYVKTKDGNTYEGSITIRESNGRIEHITVKDDQKKTTTISADNVTNFGAKRYIDKKFIGVWSLVEWKASAGTGMLVNIKSEPKTGSIILNNDQEEKGLITILKKAEIITELQLRDDPKAKPLKFKYAEVKSYSIEHSVTDYNNMLKNSGLSIDEVPPSKRFHRGTILLVDGTFHEGLIAKAVDSDFSDIYYAKEENGIIDFFAAADIETVFQDITKQTLKDYEKLIYDRDHVNDYLIQRPAQWIYKTNDDFFSETEFQQGYLITTSDDIKVGAISVTNRNSLGEYILKEVVFKEAGKDNATYKAKDIKEFGLIENEARTVFPPNWFSKKRSGFIQLLGSTEFIRGPLEIESSTDEKTGNEITNLIVNKVKYNIASVDIYGLVDVPARDLTGDGIIIYEDPKQNFHPGSFMINGNKKEGWIAWCKPNDRGDYDAFFYTDKKDGLANVYYTSRGATAINQTIEDIEAYDPLEDSFFARKTIEKEVKNNGYVITSSGQKIEGDVQLSFPPNLWFATDVTLTQANGTLSEYKNDGSLKKIAVTIDGIEKEFVNFENEYVEVLHRDGDLVHFRNPHPTTKTFTGGLANLAAGAIMEQIDRELETVGRLLGDESGQAGAYKTSAPEEKVDWTKEEVLRIYQKEYMIMDETTGRHTMYIPNKYFNQINYELMGCIEYLTMQKEAQAGLIKMQNPKKTLMFLNENMNN